MIKKIFSAIVICTVAGCGVPKDVYYAEQNKRQSPQSSEKTVSSKKEIYDPRYSRGPVNKSKNSSKNSSSREYKNDISRKEKFNQDIGHSSNPKSKPRIYNSLERNSSSSFMNYAPPMSINRKEFVKQAKEYIGVRYKYGGTTRQSGLDCSGFVMNVFNDFGIKSPRVSRDIALYGQEIPLEKAKIGDLIFFTGRNHASGIVGHLGIITSTHPQIEFIHSATSNNIGVIISEFKGYYKDHFIKVMSVLK